MQLSQVSISRRGIALSILTTLIGGTSAFATDYRAMLAPYVSDDTFAVVCLNVESIPLPADTENQIDQVIKLPGVAKDLGVGLLMAEGLVKKLKAAGAEQVCAIAGLGDMHDGGGPLFVISVNPGKSPDVERSLKGMLQEIIDSPSSGHWRTDAQDFDVRQAGGVVLAGTKGTVARYTSEKSTSRDDLLGPFAKLASDNSMLSGVFCPGPDFRRVVRELWPKLPGSLAPLRGELADRWISLEGSINLPPNMSPKLSLQTKDAEAAETFAKLWRDMPTATTEFGDKGDSSRMVQGYAQLLVTMLPASVEGTRVNIGFPSEASQFAQLGSMFSAAADKSMEKSRRVERVNRLKQLILAMFNYDAVNKHFPPAAICDKDGKPLFSWRVALLPYLGEEDLFKEFHLDEPWDSSHNRTLVDKMPDIFADPDPKVRSAAGVGKTTFQVPVGKETLFFNNEGTSPGQIKDGAANTIAIIEVDPEVAIEWTKPGDWKVDMAHPSQALGKKPNIAAAFADGHVQVLSHNDLSDGQLRAQLTRAGGEQVEH
jgi:hypothetical protein